MAITALSCLTRPASAVDNVVVGQDAPIASVTGGNSVAGRAQTRAMGGGVEAFTFFSHLPLDARPITSLYLPLP